MNPPDLNALMRAVEADGKLSRDMVEFLTRLIAYCRSLEERIAAVE